MKAVSSEQMRELDRKTIEQFGIPGEELMERAGLGVANKVESLCERIERRPPIILLIAGRGNNGGDAFVAARYLNDFGFNVMVWLAGSSGEMVGDARTHLNKMRQRKIEIEEFPTKEDWEDAIELHIEGSVPVPDVIVDGVLGTGLKGPARGPAAGAINYINTLAQSVLVVSIDIPSGLDADTGAVEGDAVTADVTATMGLPKLGMLEPRAASHVGRIEAVDIGIPFELIESIDSDIELVTAYDVARFFPKRQLSTHKGDYGHLLILGGAAGYSGAVAMAARAALRSGVGLVTVLAPRSVAPIVAAAAPEAMVHGAPETEIGSLAAESWQQLKRLATSFTGLVAGPGMTRHPDTAALISTILKESAMPIVLDADALNVYEGNIEGLNAGRRAPLVITPHPGEMARLIGRSSADVQANRAATARLAALKSGAVVVLKGCGTLIAAEGTPLHVNMTGNPGMARGGTGDVLAGLLGGLLAMGLPPLDAARAAVFLHGRAGDIAAKISTEWSITAGDLIGSIPRAFRQVTAK